MPNSTIRPFLTSRETYSNPYSGGTNKSTPSSPDHFPFRYSRRSALTIIPVILKRLVVDPHVDKVDCCLCSGQDFVPGVELVDELLRDVDDEVSFRLERRRPDLDLPQDEAEQLPRHVWIAELEAQALEPAERVELEPGAEAEAGLCGVYG